MSQTQKLVLFVAFVAFATFFTRSIAQSPDKKLAVIQKGTNWNDALGLLQEHGVHEVEEDMAVGWTPGAPESNLRGYLCLIEDGVRLRIHYDASTNVVDSMRIRYAAPFLERRGNYRWFTCTKLEMHNDQSYTVRFGPRRKSEAQAAGKAK